jgi:hypothetical protein
VKARWLAVALVVAALIPAAVAAGAPAPAAQPLVSAVPIEGVAVGGGKKLWVHVYLAGNAKGGGKPQPAPTCPTDVNSQTAYKLFGMASPNGLTFKLAASSPAGAATGLGSGMAAWNGVRAGYLSLQSSGGASGPADDGTNSVGWGRFAQPNVLAATWTWTDAGGRIDEADMFFNTRYTWANLVQCGGSSYDIGNIAAHELGHALGLDHVSDVDRQATMYPSAPAGEVLKRTLTAGDRNGFLASLQP